MNKNDERILMLKKQIEDKKVVIAKENIVFAPETNCILKIDGTTTNLNVCTEKELEFLLVKLNMYQMSSIQLGILDFRVSGYYLHEWISDIQDKLKVLEFKRKKAELENMEKELSKLLSEDKRTSLRIDKIEELLRMGEKANE